MNHKHLLITAFAIGLQHSVAWTQSALSDHPAYLDIDGAMDVEAVAPEVNVNLPKFLINSALADLEIPEEGGNEAAKVVADLKDLLSDVRLIRVLVVEKGPNNAAVIDAGMPKLNAQLKKGWTPIVSVPEDNVGVYGMGDESGEEMLGMAVVVDEGDSVVIANIVGNLSFGKIFNLLGQMRTGPGGNPLEELIAPYLGMAAPQGEVHSYDLAEPAEATE